ncbi:major facilitator superfamily-domain-containing protein [Fusarium sp. MPI-SDFR-AT-0072]|nr:major facilitator superfamily-domain-containing protein [Fusarium sp. MPI-SDFR-AT-0072]
MGRTDEENPGVQAGRSRDSSMDVEKLGRQRPEVFKSTWAELGFGFSVFCSMLMAEFFVSGFHVILPPLAEELNIPAASQTWPSSVFSLITGAMLLPMGRLSDMYGGYIVFNGGLLWFLLWALIAGFSKNYMMLIFCRALQGFGPAAYLLGGVMLMGKFYRPGPRKNLIFALYGAFAPLGFFFGIFVADLTAEYLDWRWYFWIGTIVFAVVSSVSLLAVPFDFRDRKTDITMDWWGVGTIVPGLLLVVYSLTDSSHAPNGWATPYIIVTLILGVMFLASAWYVETHKAQVPLLPADLFAPKGMNRLLAVLFMAFGTFGLFLFYSSFYMELVLHRSPLITAVWYIPMCVGGLIIGTVGGFTLHFLPGRVLLFISSLANAITMLLFALMPENPNYWAWVFPAMVCCTIGIDITFTVSNIFLTTNMPSHRQGLAGALINSVLFLGISFFLGIADIAVAETANLGLRKSYKVAFWLAFGVASIPLLFIPFIRIGSAKSELTMDERQRLENPRPSVGESEAERDAETQPQPQEPKT